MTASSVILALQFVLMSNDSMKCAVTLQLIRLGQTYYHNWKVNVDVLRPPITV
jgi:hypothetical protein